MACSTSSDPATCTGKVRPQGLQDHPPLPQLEGFACFDIQGEQMQDLDPFPGSEQLLKPIE